MDHGLHLKGWRGLPSWREKPEAEVLWLSPGNAWPRCHMQTWPHGWRLQHWNCCRPNNEISQRWADGLKETQHLTFAVPWGNSQYLKAQHRIPGDLAGIEMYPHETPACKQA